jgi:MerR family transcriptional regulator, redox-sensitive transcriptional activator SoxR
VPVTPDPVLTIGEFARRAGVAASALRFYEAQGLLVGGRSEGGRRHYPRSALRRVAFIRAAQAVGLTLEQVRAALAELPDGRTPTQADWQRLSGTWQPLLDARIAALTRLRDQLASCIGCGCLSLTRCALYNPGDAAAARGPGARYLMGERAPAAAASVPAAAPGLRSESPSPRAARAARPNPRRSGPGRT